MCASGPDGGHDERTASARAAIAAVEALSRAIDLPIQPTDLVAVSEQWRSRASRATSALTVADQAGAMPGDPTGHDPQNPDPAVSFDPGWPADR